MGSVWVIFLCFLSLVELKASPANDIVKDTISCSTVDPLKGIIGVVIDGNSRVGREQKTAIEMAVNDLRHCSDLVLHFKDSHGNSAASAVIELISDKHADTILGTITQQEATFVSQFHKHKKIGIPMVSISPTSSVSEQTAPKLSSFFQISTQIAYTMQCIAAIVGHFGWREVITINEEGNGFSSAYRLKILLSDALQAVGSSVHHHLAIPPVSYQLDPGPLIENELLKLKAMGVKVFVVTQASVEFTRIMFERAKVLGMMGEQYAWIVSDEIGNTLDSFDLYFMKNMQGVVGLKTRFVDTSVYFREFRRKFIRKYNKAHPEEENSSPSLYALRAYDAVLAIANALQKSERKTNHSTGLGNEILSSDFEGISGRISFEGGLLRQKPIFQIINVIGRSYKDAAFWSPGHGFFADITVLDGKEIRTGNGELDSIYWPGGGFAVPKGRTMGSVEKPLRIGVPCKGAFEQFVKVTYDPRINKTVISGFTIDVFEATVRLLPYHLYFEFVCHNGSYDEMVVKVHDKSLDAAVGDTEIMADRCEYVVFSQPYIDSGLQMVVTVELRIKESVFIAFRAFTKKMWIRYGAMSIATGAVIWLSEYSAGNTEFPKKPFLYLIGSILWFSVSIMSLSHREKIENGASKLVLAAWIGSVLVVGASLTAALSTLMTVPRIRPSVLDVEYLLKTNAPVGCNGHSFIDRYMINALGFKPENIRKINSIDEYPTAFARGDIKAAFFVAPHAKVFLAKYCQGFTISGNNFKLGGFGFGFQKDSPLATDFSQAILKVTQSGQVNIFEEKMLSSWKCIPKDDETDITLSDAPFSLLFLVVECCYGVAIFMAVANFVIKRHWIDIKNTMAMSRVYSWAASSLLERRFLR